MEYTQTETILGVLISLVSLTEVGILIAWFVRYPEFDSLKRCPIRRNRLPLYFPFLQLLVWLLATLLLSGILEQLLSGSTENKKLFALYVAHAVVDIAMAVFFVIIVQFAFVRGLKGFGLRFRTLGRDLFWGAVNLVAVYPVILLLLWLTMTAGQWFVGPDFDLEKHGTLTDLQTASTAFKCLLVVSTLFVVPIFEELLFRGLIQSALTTYLPSRWLAILITSVLFALLHPKTHFLGIFLLSICLGYAYEKSGSLLRSISIHLYFNAISVAGVLLSTPQN